MQFQFNDGGRAEAGFKGKAQGDCACRAIAIATGRPYREIYDLINQVAGEPVARKKVKRKVYEKILKDLGWNWVSTMKIGQGCRVHLCREELPTGILIVSVSKHLTTVIDGVIHDIFDPSRNGTRCVYGFYVQS